MEWNLRCVYTSEARILDIGGFCLKADLHVGPFSHWTGPFPEYKNSHILKNGLAYCEIALRNRTCKKAFKQLCSRETDFALG